MFLDLHMKLNNWVHKKQESIFVIDGPSQIGKTYFIKNFFQFKSIDYLYIDVKIYKNLLERLMDDTYKSADDFYTVLCFEFSTTPIVPLKTLIFDGIEYCPRIRQFFKTLVKHSRVNIIAITCGGMGPLHYKDLLVPSEEDVYHMQPLSFYEFMIEIDQNTLAEHIKESIQNKVPISEYLSSKIYSFFKTYNLIGGYPCSISLFKEKKDINACIDMNKRIFNNQFEHALYFVNEADAKLLNMIRENFSLFILNGNYNSLEGITSYKMKQLLTLLEEEYIINISYALDVENQSNKSNAKKVLFSHQCFYNAICGFEKEYFSEKMSISKDIILTDFYFNQKLNNKPLNFALFRSTRYFDSDALIVNNTSMYIVEIKEKKMFTEFNISLAEKSGGIILPGVVLLNNNIFQYGKVCVLPSYCSCFLNSLFIK